MLAECPDRVGKSRHSVRDLRLLAVPDYGARGQRGVGSGGGQRLGDGRALTEHDLSEYRVGEGPTFARVLGIVDDVAHGQKCTWIRTLLNVRSGAC